LREGILGGMWGLIWREGDESDESDEREYGVSDTDRQYQGLREYGIEVAVTEVTRLRRLRVNCNGLELFSLMDNPVTQSPNHPVTQLLKKSYECMN
jgi:hypothetical protein